MKKLLILLLLACTCLSATYWRKASSLELDPVDILAKSFYEQVGDSTNLTAADLERVVGPATVFLNNGLTLDRDIDLPDDVILRVGPAGYLTGPGYAFHVNQIEAAPYQHIFRGSNRIKIDQDYLALNWFGAKGDGRLDSIYLVTGNHTPSAHALRRALVAGGDSTTIELWHGTYVMEDAPARVLSMYATQGTFIPAEAGLQNFTKRDVDGSTVTDVYSHIKFVGQGIGRTVVTQPNVTTGAGAKLGGSGRYSAFRYTIDDLITIQDTLLDAGRRVLMAKLGSEAATVQAGMDVVFIGGANYTDQGNRSHHKVDSVRGNKIYLREGLSENLSLSHTSYNGVILEKFVQPGIGDTVHVQASAGLMDISDMITIGTDVYETLNDRGNGTFVIRNPGKANLPPGTVVPAGTRTRKAVGLVIIDGLGTDIEVEDMTIVGRRNGITLVSVQDITYDHVELIHAPMPGTDGGLTFNWDGGRGVTFQNGIVRVIGPAQAAQIARSAQKGRWINNTISGMIFDFSEFSHDHELAYNTINLDVVFANPREAKNTKVINIGRTTGGIKIHHNRIEATGTNYLISGTSDVNGARATMGGGNIISYNVMVGNDIKSGFHFSTMQNDFSHNLIEGSFDIIFTDVGAEVNPSSNSSLNASMTSGGETFDIASDGGGLILDNTTVRARFERAFQGDFQHVEGTIRFYNLGPLNGSNWDQTAASANRGRLFKNRATVDPAVYINLHMILHDMPFERDKNPIDYRGKLPVDSRIKATYINAIELNKEGEPTGNRIDTVLCVGCD